MATTNQGEKLLRGLFSLVKGLWKIWSAPARTAQKDPPALREFLTEVHGIFHQNDDGSSRQKIIRDCRPGEEMKLVLEPDNKFDSDAIKICRLNGQQIGYWSGGDRMAGELRNGRECRVTIARIYEFEDRPGRPRGVELRIEVLK